jgi:hypothetical protein
MANSGIHWIDSIYDWAVSALIECAKLLGITYEEINVWLFCVAWPIATIIMIIAIIALWRDNRNLRRGVAT